MPEPLSYHVYDSRIRKWLSDDEQTWTVHFSSAAGFTSLELANGIMEREGGDYVFACMPSA
jgi:hypothetical protein